MTFKGSTGIMIMLAGGMMLVAFLTGIATDKRLNRSDVRDAIKPLVLTPPGSGELHEECFGGIVYYAMQGGSKLNVISIAPKINPRTMTYIRCEVSPNNSAK